MNKSNLLLSAAVAGLLSVGAASVVSAESDSTKGKCYGIAKAGQNACANSNGVHGCHAEAKVDNDPGDFTLATAAECEKSGGKTTAPAK